MSSEREEGAGSHEEMKTCEKCEKEAEHGATLTLGDGSKKWYCKECATKATQKKTCAKCKTEAVHGATLTHADGSKEWFCKPCATAKLEADKAAAAEDAEEFVEGEVRPDFIPENPPFAYQFRAVMTKNMALQRKSYLQMCCICVMPLLIIVLFGVLKIVIDNANEGQAELMAGNMPEPAEPSYRIYDNLPDSRNFYSSPGPVYLIDSDDVLRDDGGYFASYNNLSGIVGSIALMLLHSQQPRTTLVESAVDELSRMWVLTDDNRQIVEYGNRSAVMGLNPDELMVFLSDQTFQDPSDDYYNHGGARDGSDIEFIFFPSIVEAQAEAIVARRREDACYQGGPDQDGFYNCDGFLPRMMLEVRAADVADPTLDATVYMSRGEYEYQSEYFAQFVQEWFRMYFLRSKPASQTFMGLPQKVPQKDQTLYISLIVGPFLFPLGVMFLFPLFVMAIVSEKELKLREMMKMMGMGNTAYWLNNFAYDLMVYLVQMTLFLVIGAIFNVELITGPAGIITVLLYVGWGIAQIGMSFVFSAFFSRTRPALLFTFFLAFFGGLIIPGVLSTEFPAGDPSFDTYPAVPVSAYLYPPMAFIRGLAVISYACQSTLGCPSSIDEMAEMPSILAMLWGWGLVLVVLGVYLDSVLPQQYGVRRSPCCCFEDLFAAMTGKHSAKKRDEVEVDDISDVEALLSGKSSTGDVEMDDLLVDDDVRKEYERVVASTSSPDHGVVCLNVRKVYGDKVAVRGVTMALDSGRSGDHKQGFIFGLLGANGAGKTTLINCLTGMTEPSGGTALVGGADIRYSMPRVHRMIGVCPQLDIYWPTLTVRETLMFYTNLKGIFGRNAKMAVTTALEDVELLEAAGKQVKELSGGMRRRVSVAVALTGNPKVSFFDEPSSSLDVSTQRSLWKVLRRAKRGRCLILTTHSMEEAEALSDRIGIMSKGALQAIGTPTHLKNKFGNGYSIQITFDVENEAKAAAFVEDLVPGCSLYESYPGKRTYKASTQQLLGAQRLSVFFDKMTSEGTEHGIINFGLGISTLEDVFLNLIKRDEEEEEELIG